MQMLSKKIKIPAFVWVILPLAIAIIWLVVLSSPYGVPSPYDQIEGMPAPPIWQSMIYSIAFFIAVWSFVVMLYLWHLK